MFRQEGMEFCPSSTWVVSGGAWAATTFSSLGFWAERKTSVGRQLPKTPPGQTTMRNLQTVLDVLGTEDSKVKEECKPHCNVPKHVATKPVQSVSPEAAKTAARVKVDRLEKAFGDYDGPELAGLKQASKKARESAQELLVDMQITQCKEFIEARNALPEWRRSASPRRSLLEEGRARLDASGTCGLGRITALQKPSGGVRGIV